MINPPKEKPRIKWLTKSTLLRYSGNKIVVGIPYVEPKDSVTTNHGIAQKTIKNQLLLNWSNSSCRGKK